MYIRCKLCCEADRMLSSMGAQYPLTSIFRDGSSSYYWLVRGLLMARELTFQRSSSLMGN